MSYQEKTQPKPICGFNPGRRTTQSQDPSTHTNSEGRPPCDLHVHTTASDGFFSPEEVVESAREKGLSAIGICDHDTISGVLSLPSLVIDGVEIIPGVEINSRWDEKEIHILGYFIPLRSSPLLDVIEELRRARYRRVAAMVEKLGKIGMPLELNHVLSLAKGDSVGRPHVAQAMVEKGYVRSVKEAFDEYLNLGRPGYVARFHLSPMESIKVIRESGGVPVWAHPGTAGSDFLLPDFLKAGLLGLEVYHPQHDYPTQERYFIMAKDNGLVATGGSDFHGPYSSEGGDLGDRVVPYEVVERLKCLSRNV